MAPEVKAIRRVAFAAAICAPILLLLDLRSSFYFDWYNSLWITGYFGEFIKGHLAAPSAIHSASAVGNPLPVFYGYLLYPLIGVLSALLGAAIALRAAVAFVIGLQFLSIYIACRKTLVHRGVSFAVSSSVIWSVYSLTNLYNRSAIPEFIACGLLFSGVAFAIAGASAGPQRQQRFFYWLAFVCALFCLGSHPPTMVVAAPEFTLLAGLLAAGSLKRPKKPAWASASEAVAGLAAAAAVLGPWFLATIRMRRQLATATSFSSPMVFLAERSDSLLGRLSPFSYDRLSIEKGANVQTPYLEAPIDSALLILLCFNLFLLARSRRLPDQASSRESTVWNSVCGPVLALSLAGFACLLSISISPSLDQAIPLLGGLIQFAYRLVSHANLALMLAAIASGTWVANRGLYNRFSVHTAAAAAACISISAVSLGMKLEHGYAVRQADSSGLFSFSGDRTPLVTGGNSWLDALYATPSRVRELPAEILAGAPHVNFPVEASGGRFGDVETMDVDLPQAQWVLTNVCVFPWNRVLVNGKRWDGDGLGRQGHLLALFLPAGHSALRFVWRPDPFWHAFDLAGRMTAAIVLLATGAWALAELRIRFNTKRASKARC